MRASLDYPEDFDSLEHDDQYQTFVLEREREFLADLESDRMLQNMTAALNMVDAAMRKR